MSGNKQSAKVVGGKPLTYEVQGEVIEAGKGAEKAAQAASRGVPSRLGHDGLNRGNVDLSRALLEALVWQSYVQGRADEAATRGDSK